MELKVTPWTDETPPSEEELEESLIHQDLRVYRWSSPPQGVIEGHTHGYHKVVYVVSGSVKFEFPTRHKSLTLGPGDRLDLPAGIRHTAVAGLDGVRCLEAHIH